MANNLGKLAHAYGLQFWLQREYNLNTTMVIRHQEVRKWKRGAAALQKCFPITRDWDFSAGNVPEVDAALAEQRAWVLGKQLDEVNNRDLDEVQQALQTFVELQRHERARPPNTTVSFPFLYSDQLKCDSYVDRYYDDLRRLFAFDPACCKLKPEPDEVVFVSSHS